jgi:hypothetical protein
MSTATKGDHAVLDALDFDPGCDITYRAGGDRCTATAAWVLTVAAHDCRSDGPAGRTVTRLLCAEHREQILAGARWRCLACREVVVVLPYVRRMEPLR